MKLKGVQVNGLLRKTSFSYQVKRPWTLMVYQLFFFLRIKIIVIQINEFKMCTINGLLGSANCLHSLRLASPVMESSENKCQL